MALPKGIITNCRCSSQLFAALLHCELQRAGVQKQRIVLEHPFDPGEPRRRFDIAVPDLMVAIECDGWGHRCAQRFARDRHRDRTALELGWHVLRYTTDEIGHRTGATVDQVVRVIRKRLETEQPRSGRENS
jgi:very-short-patch-repair endonuclease